MSLVTLPRSLLVDVNGAPRVGAKAYFYQSATTTEITVYTTASYATPHTNPVESVLGAEFSGLFPAVYINPAVNATFKLVLTDEDDVEIYSADNIPALGFTLADLGSVLYPRTTAEIAAGVTPTVYSYPPGDVRRYGATGGADDTVAIQAAITVVQSVYLPDGNWIVSALTLSNSGVTISGPGVLVKKANVDGRVLYITGDRNQILGVRFDGTAAAPTSGSLNDMLRIQGGDGNVVDGCYINGSRGGGIRVDGGSKNRITNNIVLSVYHNSILVCNPGADDNLVSGNYCNGTTTGNNIFLTADDGSVASGAFIYRNIVTGNHCTSAADTGIESGYHSYYAVIANNFCTGSPNPAILVRDGFGVSVTDNVILNMAYASQSAEYGAITVVPHHETAAWNYSTKIKGNIAIGSAKRSDIYVGGSFVTVEENTLYDNETSITAAGVGLVGQGIALAGAVTDVIVRGNSVRRFEIGVDLNQDAGANARSRIEVADNNIYETSTAINGFNCTFTDSAIRGNTITKVVVDAVKLTSATIASGELRYLSNTVNLAGWSGATPVEIAPATALLRTFAAADATPSVAGGKVFRTDSGALTITAFDDGIHEQEVTVISTGAVTFDTTGSSLSGSSVDLVTASGDVTRWVCDGGTTWRLIAFVDASVDNSAGA